MKTEREIKEIAEQRMAEERFRNGIEAVKEQIDTWFKQRIQKNLPGLEETEYARLRGFIDAAKTRDERNQVSFYQLTEPRTEQTLDPSLNRVTHFIDPEYQVVYGDDDAPTEYLAKEKLGDIYEIHLELLRDLAESQPGVSKGERHGQVRPPKAGDPRLKEILTRALDGTRLGQDADAIKKLLAALESEQSLAETTVATVAVAAPGKVFKATDPTSFIPLTEVVTWPDQPSAPVWDRSTGKPPPQGVNALVIKQESLKSVVAELFRRERIRHFDRHYGDERLAHLDPVWW